MKRLTEWLRASLWPQQEYATLDLWRDGSAILGLPSSAHLTPEMLEEMQRLLRDALDSGSRTIVLAWPVIVREHR